MGNFCEEAKLYDRTLHVADIDRCFIAANLSSDIAGVEGIGVDDGKPNSMLCRYEFLEILVRIADQKYRRSKLVATFAEALQRLLNHIYANFPVAAWQEYRENSLWGDTYQ